MNHSLSPHSTHHGEGTDLYASPGDYHVPRIYSNSMMDQILECCEGAMGIKDDVVIHGKDGEDHDQNLHNFMYTACKHGIIFNRETCGQKGLSNILWNSL